jgi:hypothetical protein
VRAAARVLTGQRSHPMATSWNGYNHGMPAENGTFIWMASYVNTDTKAQQFLKGFVLVLH